jgi:lincosamide and streptogramin A transport system ATP-binding/permease protein
MSMIKVSNLTFSYPNGYEDVFSDVSFQIDTDWKLGLIGRNGRGKTTLLFIEHDAAFCEEISTKTIEIS